MTSNLKSQIEQGDHLFQLAAHTENANGLTKRLLQSQVTQTDYDAQIYSTCIVSTDRVKSIPIILTIDDTLATLIAFANREFQIPPAQAQTTEIYVLWSAKTFHAIGVHPVPENKVLLDQDRLKMILQFMKASPQVEQLLVEFEDDVADAAAKLERDRSPEVGRSAPEPLEAYHQDLGRRTKEGLREVNRAKENETPRPKKEDRMAGWRV